MGKEKRDFRALRTLLTSWNLTELIEYFESEDINVEELQLVKPHQLPMLLRDYKMGLRIRFEYYFEKWRRDNNLPLQSSEALSSSRCNCFHSCKNMNIPPPMTMLNPEYFVKSNLTDSFTQIDEPEESMIVEVPPPNIEISSNTENDSMHAPNLTLPAALSPEKKEPEAATRKIAAQNAEFIRLIDILKSFGSTGTSILDFYKKNQELAPGHRSLLIQLIVDFFDQHEMHLSLNMSHNLENQILTLFPTEKLKNYRKEKRGKIYVKFVNMKRYRRERPLQERFKRRHTTYQNNANPHILNGDSNNSVIIQEEESTQGFHEHWPDPLGSHPPMKSEAHML